MMRQYKHVLDVICILAPDKSRATNDMWLKMLLKRDGEVANSTSRGRRYHYDWVDVTYLALVSELNSLGISPANAAAMLKESDWKSDWTSRYIVLSPNRHSKSKITIDHRRITKAISKVDAAASAAEADD